MDDVGKGDPQDPVELYGWNHHYMPPSERQRLGMLARALCLAYLTELDARPSLYGGRDVPSTEYEREGLVTTPEDMGHVWYAVASLLDGGAEFGSTPEIAAYIRERMGMRVPLARDAVTKGEVRAAEAFLRRSAAAAIAYESLPPDPECEGRRYVGSVPMPDAADITVQVSEGGSVVIYGGGEDVIDVPQAYLTQDRLERLHVLLCRAAVVVLPH